MKHILYYLIRGGSRTAVTSKMERFVIIVNGWKPLTIITKRSILDVAAVLDPLLLVIHLYPKHSWKLQDFVFQPISFKERFYNIWYTFFPTNNHKTEKTFVQCNIFATTLSEADLGLL